MDAGACVLGLDINPDVASTFKSPAFMGIPTDLCDTAAVTKALET